MLKISIIVPLYNMEAYLAKTLDSLIAQTLQDIEILCIDDGSTDSSPDILERYRRLVPQKIKVFRKVNGGIADARNFGLSKVTAPYFAFVDSDDTVEPNMMETLYLKAIETKAQMVTCNFWWSEEKGERLQKDGPYLNQKELLTHMFATLWNKLYETAWIRSTNLSFPTGYRYEDASFLYKLVPYLERWSYVDEAFIHYLQRPGSITHNHNDKVKDMIHVFEDLLLHYHHKGFYESYQPELEYLFIRFFLGNSFLRSCQIVDKHDRKLTLDLSYKVLTNHFPNWRRNDYLRKGGLKDKYYLTVNDTTYSLYATVFHFLYRIKG